MAQSLDTLILAAFSLQRLDVCVIFMYLIELCTLSYSKLHFNEASGLKAWEKLVE